MRLELITQTGDYTVPVATDEYDSLLTAFRALALAYTQDPTFVDESICDPNEDSGVIKTGDGNLCPWCGKELG